MPIQIPVWVAEKLDLSATADGGHVFSDSADTSEFEYSVIIPSILELAFSHIEPVQIEQVGAWRYAEISVGGAVVCELIEVPTSWGEGRAPTAIETVLAQAWLLSQDYDPATICQRFANHVLIGWRTGAESGVGSDVVIAASGLSRRQKAMSLELALRTKTRIEISQDSALMGANRSGVYARLFQRAVSENHVELTFLYFYRVFERAYLNSAYKKLSDDFFDDPRQALANAEKTVSNERLSFISLVESSDGVKSWFELIEQEVRAAAESNKFLAAILRSCTKDGWLAERETWKKGCSICYKIRCAIVHSGERGPIFEEFADADSACAVLAPYMEGAVVSMLGIAWSRFQTG